MRRITSLFVAFGLAASFAAAQEGQSCPACNAPASAPTALATARKALADAPKAEEKLTADQRAELKAARDTMMQMSVVKAMGQSYEACGWAMLAAAKQPGTAPAASALLMDMGATYCSAAKIFGGCADCKCCEDSAECCKFCKDMTVESATQKAKETLASSKKAMAAAMADMQKMTPDQAMKMQTAMNTMQQYCPVFKAMQGVNDALNGGVASLAKMGIPSAEGKNGTVDELVKGALEIHSQVACGECEESEGCEGCDEGCEGCEDAEENEGAEMPRKSS